MPYIRRRRVTRKKGLSKRRTYRKRTARKMRNQPEKASMSEVRTMTASNVNQIYSLLNTKLADFPRATAVGQNYAQFRITNIKLRVKSPYDSYINTGPAALGSYQKPYFYYMLDKTGSIPTNITLEGLKGMGAKPIALDEKQITISWAPTVLSAVGTSGAGNLSTLTKPRAMQWLATDNTPENATFSASQVEHFGVYWGAFASLQGVSNPITYDVECEVQFQFKKPLIRSQGNTQATPAAFAEVNSSIDGVVGGPDGE